MGFRRGFKSQCERRSVEIRKDFGLGPVSALSAHDYARQLGIVVWTEQDIEGVPAEHLLQLTRIDGDSWSAFTMRVSDRYLVVINSTQGISRVNSVLMHEISHIALGHELTSGAVTEDGYFVPVTYDEDQEAEADWFAGTLLLPRPALLYIRRLGMSDQEAGDKFMVSRAMLQWRIRMTGVDYQLQAMQRKRNTRIA